MVTSQLANGLTLLCLEKETAPIISVQLWYGTGSVNETAGVRGASHLLEHMMFRGSRRFESEEHARRINETGGHCNAFTAEDVTAYINSVPADHLDLVLELEADRMTGLQLETKVLETEKSVVAEEFHTYMNNPVARSFLAFRKAFYGDNPYAWSPLGSLEDIQSITAADLRSYYHSWYRPDHCTLVVTGDIGSFGRLREKVERWFGGLEPVAPERRFVPAQADLSTVNRRAPGTMKRRVEFDVPILLVGYPAPPSSHPDALPLEILQQVLSNGETSRIHREVVRRRSLAVMAGGMNHFMRSSGMSLFFAAYTPDVSVSRLTGALNAEIERVCQEPITSREMDKVVNTTLAHRVFERYSAEQCGQRIGFSQVVEGDFRLWEERLTALREMKPEDLVRAAKKWWVSETRRILNLKPKKSRPLLYLAGILRRMTGRRESS